MKKFISKITSAAISASILFNAAMTVSAEVVNVEPDYPIHGNKCGIIFVMPEIDRDVYIKITQYTPDGDYVYYDTPIASAGDAVGENEYSFYIEGKDDITYDIEIGVPKYKTSSEPMTYTYNFQIKDTDDIVDDVINGYAFYFELVGGTDFDVPTLIDAEDIPRDENNIIVEKKTIYFPISNYKLGDVNSDNKVNLQDVIEIAKYMMDKSRLNAEQKLAADFDGNQKVDLQDAIAIAKSIMNKT